jgi:hypothetical protein
MTQTDSKRLAIQCGKLRVERLFFSNVSSIELLYCKNPLLNEIENVIHICPEAYRFLDAFHHQIPHPDTHTADTKDNCLEPGVPFARSGNFIDWCP